MYSVCTLKFPAFAWYGSSITYCVLCIWWFYPYGRRRLAITTTPIYLYWGHLAICSREEIDAGIQHCRSHAMLHFTQRKPIPMPAVVGGVSACTAYIPPSLPLS